MAEITLKTARPQSGAPIGVPVQVYPIVASLTLDEWQAWESTTWPDPKVIRHEIVHEILQSEQDHVSAVMSG